jgi:transcriptional regulator with GAF, ATPase, and Fis domain
MSVDPTERNMPATRLGLRSSLRIPIRIDGRVAGAVIFSAFQTNRYTVADVPIARRIADYVTLALSHQRLADNARDAAAVRERAVHLEMLDGLLNTLSGVLDVREVFDRVSQVCDKVMTHDAMSVSIPSDNNQTWTIHVATGALGHVATPFVMRPPTPRLLESHWDYELVDDMTAHERYNGTPSVNAGMRSLLSMPVWVEGKLRAAVNFYSHTPGHFTTDDVIVTRRIADHIALALSHQQLAEEASRNVEMQARAANIELLDELLATLSDTTAMTDLFDRLSTIARKVIAHDTVVLAVGLPDGRHARIVARGGERSAQFPEIVEIPETLLKGGRWEHELVDDLQAHPTQKNLLAAKLGYRSALRIPIRIEDRFMGALVFFSFEPAAFKTSDALIARRIADRITLVLARERGVEASKRADEASARASKLESRVRALTEELDARTGYRRVVGESAPWRQVLTQATQVASTETTVLLLGESGTGKEVVARFLHRASARASGPFVALNCAALPEQLLEAELFGYERGAFTGATQSKPGQLEQAGGGTLFLDEVGEMSPPAQAKFLRVLQEREFQRLGGTRVLRTDARIVAATNRDLQRAMQQGTFREDLFYRLNVFAIRLPALRDRPDDVLPLSEAFLSEYGRSLGRPPAGISREAKQKLTDYQWPGNVRELRNTLERAAILCEGGLITDDHLGLNVAPRPVQVQIPAAVVAQATAPAMPPPPAPSPPAGDLSSMERSMIEQALQNARFNKSKAAKELGLTRAQLYVRMRRHGLE